MIGDVLGPEYERAATEIVDSAFKVHAEFGPGLLESVYETCLAYELRKRVLRVRRQVMLPIIYDGVVMEGEYFRMDLVVEESIIVEVKAVEKVIPLYEAQTMTQLKLSHHRLAFLINFNVRLIKDGIKRIIN